MPTPDYDVHRNHKERMQRRVVRTLFAVAFLYVAFLAPDELAQVAVHAAASRASWASRLLSVAVGTPTLAWTVSFLLFASDSAFKGSNPTASWLRRQFAANAAVEKYACDASQASALWFGYFDTWALERSPYRTLLATTYSATYAARAVFYLRRALLLFFLLGSASVGTSALAFCKYAGPAGRLRLAVDGLVLAAFGSAFVFIGATNRLPRRDAASTGCWARLEDVLGRSRAHFQQDVLRHAPTLDAAFDRLGALRRVDFAPDRER